MMIAVGIGRGFVAMTSGTRDAFSAIWSWAMSGMVLLVEFSSLANKRIRTERQTDSGDIVLDPPRRRMWISVPCNIMQKFYMRAVVYCG